MINRESIHAALFALLSASASFVTTSRRLQHWSDVPSEQQPALFLTETGQTATTVKGQPTVWTLQCDVYLYLQTTPDQSPGQMMNPYLDAIETALLPGNAMETNQTLGGLVSHCWIEGQIQTDEGLLGSQAVAIIPIKILAS